VVGGLRWVATKTSNAAAISWMLPPSRPNRRFFLVRLRCLLSVDGSGARFQVWWGGTTPASHGPVFYRPQLLRVEVSCHCVIGVAGLFRRMPSCPAGGEIMAESLCKTWRAQPRELKRSELPASNCHLQTRFQME